MQLSSLFDLTLESEDEETNHSKKPAAELLPFRLLDLPAELQTVIISFLLRPEHLARVCLASKQLQQLALPLLYRDFSINVSDWSDDALERICVRGHRGHSRIRSLEVDSVDLDGEDQALKIAKDMLQVLPRNGLRSFRCPLEDGIDNDLLILLAAQQRALTSVCIGTLRENALNLIDALQPWPPAVKTIIIPWKLLSTRDYAFYHELIERSRKSLKALTIRVNDFAWLNQPVIGGENAEACEDLARGLFGHGEKESDYNRPPLELRDINFQNQNLEAFDTTWRQYIDFTKLRTIQVWNCNHTDCMLQSLIDISKKQTLRLEGLVLSFEEFLGAPTLAQEFLRSITGLRYLNLCYVPPHRPTVFDIRCLLGHKDTLQDLYIGIGTNLKPPPYTHSDLWQTVYQDMAALWDPSWGDVHWLSTCQNLKQLAIAMPEIKIDDALAGRSELWGFYLDYLTVFATNLPRLKVLRLLTWPIDCNQHHAHGNESPHWDYIHSQYLLNLDIVAESIARLFCNFRGDHQDRLSVLTFGNAERDDHAPTLAHGPMRMNKPVTYKIRQVESEYGLLTKVERVDPADMQWEEPMAYVFDEDTDQGLSLEAYPWGSG